MPFLDELEFPKITVTFIFWPKFKLQSGPIMFRFDFSCFGRMGFCQGISKSSIAQHEIKTVRSIDH